MQRRAPPLALLALLAAALASCGRTADEPSPSLDAVYERLDELAEDYGAELRTIGYGGSAAFRDGDASLPIRSLRIEGADWVEGGPRVQVLGALHGNEQLGAALALSLAELALGAEPRYGRARAAPAGLSAIALDIVPAANPWGYANDARSVYAGGAAADPNREFPMDWFPGTGGFAAEGSAPAWPEIAALAADAASERYAVSIALHSGAYRICVPWDYIGTTSSLSVEEGLDRYTLGAYADLYSPAHPWFLARGAAYAARVEAAAGEEVGSFPLVQGYDWYYAGGTFGDWAYLRVGTAPFTVEVSPLQGADSFTEASVEATIDEQLGALAVLACAGSLGVSGTVTDAATGEALVARVEASPSSSSRAGSWTDPVRYRPFGYSGGAAGSFRIALQPGGWTLAASAPGYEPASLAVEIGDSGRLEGAAIRLLQAAR